MEHASSDWDDLEETFFWDFNSLVHFLKSPNVMYYLVWIGSVSGGFGYWRSEIFFVGGSLCNAVAF